MPSRLYYGGPTRDRPLSGVRLAVPDALDLGGAPTTVASRAWRALRASSPARASVPLARRLQDLGAVVVAKARSSHLVAARQWVDEPAPWNPRGDSYQRPAAAVASYAWIRTAGEPGRCGPPRRLECLVCEKLSDGRADGRYRRLCG